MQTLLQCLYSLRVQLHVSASVCTLQIPGTGSHTFVWTRKSMTRTVWLGSAALVAAGALPRYDDPNFPQGIYEELNKK